MLDIGIWNPRVGLPRAGGTETFVRNIANELDKRDDTSVTVYTHTDGRLPAALESVRVRRVPTLPKEHAANQLLSVGPVLDSEIESVTSYARGRLQQTFQGTNHDIVTTHYYLDALLVSHWTDAPTAFRLPGIKHASPRWKALFRYANIDCYVSNSMATTQRVADWFDIDLRGPIYAGVDCDQFKPGGETKDNCALYVGRLGDGKGLPNLLGAASKLPDGYTVRIVGDGPLRSELAAQAPSNVELVGPVAHEDIHREYQRAAVVVLPSVHEGFAVTVIEALATGTPVIATDLDSTRLTIDDGLTGMLLPDRNQATIADAIRTVCLDGSYATNANEDGRQVALEYDWQATAADFREILTDAISERQRNRADARRQ